MPIYLRSDGVNDVAQFASAITIASLGTQAWTFRYKGNITAPAGTTAIAGTSSSSTVAGPAVSTSGQLIIRSSANVTVATSPTGFIIFGEDHKYECDHLAGGAISWKRDDIEVGTGSYTGGASWTNINQFFRATSAATARLQADTEYIEFVGTVNANKWDANLSNGTGNVLPTTSGANAAGLINFPTNGDQWVNTGSGEISSTAAWSITPLVWQSSAAVSPPTFSSTTAWSVSPLVWQGSAAATVPAFTSATAWSITPLVWQGVANASAPGAIASTATWAISPLVWQGSANASAPAAIASTAAWSIGPLVWQGSAAATVPTFTSTTAWSVSPLVWQGAADATAPGANVATVAWSITPLVWQGSAAATVPTYTSAAAWSITPLVWRVSASVGGAPVFAAKGATITERLPSRAIIERLQTARITE